MNERLPKYGELVVCRVTRINPHSAIVYILEYDTTGMIHVSEIASRWVRDIREFVRENEYIVCRVLDARPEGISLSLKRVHREDTVRKLNEFKREKRSEKLLEMVGKSLDRTLEQTKKEIGSYLIEEFGSFTKLFEIAFRTPDLLTRKGMPEKWTKAIIEIAQKNFADKTFVVKGHLRLTTNDPDGVGIIKKILLSAKKQGLEIQYVSAPKYILVGEGKNYKEVESKVRSVGEDIVREFLKHGEATLEMEK
ncbi:S1 RNA-binding domain-containing protein [Candidatus Micrarchaeota archaeon]|nr:S1 RNA-binding domain-containing protein [Candidatus Micrarchaeota archaeon]